MWHFLRARTASRIIMNLQDCQFKEIKSLHFYRPIPFIFVVLIYVHLGLNYTKNTVIWSQAKNPFAKQKV